MYNVLEIPAISKNLLVRSCDTQPNSKDSVNSFNRTLNEKFGVNPIISEMESKYGVEVTIASLSKTYDGSTSGFSGLRNVIISPKALKEMESNPKLKEKVTADIKTLIDPAWDMEQRAVIKLAGLREKNRGIIVHDDGTVSWFGTPELSEEGEEYNKQFKKLKDTIYLPTKDNLYDMVDTDTSEMLYTNSYLLSIIGGSIVNSLREQKN